MIEGVPDGWELVRIGRPDEGEFYLDNLCNVQRSEVRRMSSNYPIVKQVEPPEPKYIPWTKKTCPVGAVIVSSTGNRSVIVEALEECCTFGSSGSRWEYDLLLRSKLRHNGEPCGTRVDP